MTKDQQILILAQATKELGEINITIKESGYCLRILQRLEAVVEALSAEKAEEEKTAKEEAEIKAKLEEEVHRINDEIEIAEAAEIANDEAID